MREHRFQMTDGSPWRTIDATATRWGYSVSENADRFERERMVEGLTRWVGVLTIVAGFVAWILPPAVTAGGLMSQTAAGAVCLGIGTALYAFATRGFRKELQFHAEHGQIRIASLNSGGQARVQRSIDLRRIESFYVRRSTDINALAKLCVRFRGIPNETVVMRGACSDMEEMHCRLCADVQAARAPVRKVLPQPQVTVAALRPRRVSRKAVPCLRPDASAASPSLSQA